MKKSLNVFMTLSVDFYKGIVVFFRQSQIRTIHLSVKTLQFQSVAMKGCIKGGWNISIKRHFHPLNGTQLAIPHIEFPIVNQITASRPIIKITTRWPLRIHLITFQIIPTFDVCGKIMLEKSDPKVAGITRWHKRDTIPCALQIHIRRSIRGRALLLLFLRLFWLFAGNESPPRYQQHEEKGEFDGGWCFHDGMVLVEANNDSPVHCRYWRSK